MTWIKLHDNAPRHPKVAGLSDRAFRAWVDGLCYASEFLTDGVLPPAFISTLSTRVLGELIESGLWGVPENGRVTIHHYLEHQSSRELVSQKKAEAAARLARHRTRGHRPVENVDDNADATPPEAEAATAKRSPLRPPRGQTKMPRFVTLGARKQ